jgi:hypothetical protein
MKGTFTAYAIRLLLLIITTYVSKGFGQILSYANATNGSLNSVAANATGTGLLRVNGAAASGSCSTGFSSNNFSGTTIYSSSLAAVEVSVTPKSGFSLNVTGFTVDLNRSSTGPASIRFAYSANGGSSWTAQGSNQTNRTGACGKTRTLSWSTSVSVIAPATLKFRIYGFNAKKASGTEQILNLKINGTVSASSSCGIASGLSGTNITSSSATLDWSDVSGATGYNIQYRKTGTATWANTTSTTSSKAVSGLASSTTYEFQVQTVCSGGTSVFSSSATFTTSASTACGVATVYPAFNITSSSASFDWSDVSGAIGYNIQYRKTGTTTWTSTTSTTSSKSVSGLTPSTTYEFQIQTICSGGTGAFSSSRTFTTSASTACGVATGLTGTSITSSSATLDWNDVSGATSYNIQYRKTGSTTWTSTTSTTSSKAVSGLASSTSYEFQVQTVCSGENSAFSSPGTFTTLSSGGASVPTPDHVVILILENRSYSQIIGSSAAPRINALANDPNSALFTQSYGIEHPSQPNYLDFYSGSNQGVTDNNIPAGIPFTTPNLGRSLINASRSFITYSEDLPSVGYNGATSGAYVRKHNPVTNWMGTGTNQVPATTNQPFTAFPSSTNYASLPTVCYVVPNLNNDMHDGSITTGDNWMYNNLNNYIQWAKTHNSLFILTFDEDNGSEGNRVVTIFTGPMVAGGQYSGHIDHFNVLRTIEDMYKLPYAGNASSPITNCWKSPVARPAIITSSNVQNKVTVYPSPAASWVNFNFSKLPTSPVLIKVFDMAGKLEGQYQVPKTQNFKINVERFSGGNYYYNIIEDNLLLHSGIFLIKRN